MSESPLSTLLSHALLAFTIELDNEFECRFAETGQRARVVSVVMWSNFLRVVGEGTTVEELVQRGEVRALHVPVRLLALHLQIDAIDESLVQ